MPLQATSGAASQDGFGGNGVPVIPNYIEEVFSTFLYTGTGSARSIINGIDLSTKGGLVWIKGRSNAEEHALFDSARGITGANVLQSNAAAAELTETGFTSLNSDGFSLAAPSVIGINTNNRTYVSWTFRKQPKFFDMVTFVATSGKDQRISHSLGSVPGCIIVKPINTGGGWYVYHRSLSGAGASAYQNFLSLESTAAVSSSALTNRYWGSANPTSTDFGLSDELFYDGGTEASRTYIAYIFAHDAGGFGRTGTDNVISCGSFTTDGSGAATVNLGYEPQWVMQKRTDSSTGGNWYIADNMRGMTVFGARGLFPNLADVEEGSDQGPVRTNATGFTASRFANATYMYVAIRRGPMKVPTSGTSVFSPVARTGTGTATSISGVGFVPDFFLSQNRNAPGDPGPASSLSIVLSRLTNLKFLRTQQTNAEGDSTEVTSWNQSGVSLSADTYGRVNDTSVNTINYFMGRAPSFMDVVCFTANGTYPQVLNHNLTVAPELIIRKPRSIADEWVVGFDFQTSSYKKMALNTTAAQSSYGSYSSGELPGKPTATQFTDQGSESGRTFVAYLFATCAGVSKVGSYTGNGTTQTIDCGFTGGARFVLIKKSSGTGDWMVSDSARGIVSGNDPYLELNNTNAEVTGEDWLDTDSTGFVVNEVSGSNANTNGATYIFLAIA